MKKYLLFAIAFFNVIVASAQDAANNSQTSGMNSNGKIWVVMTVCITILTGLILYVASLDRKLSKLEKKGD